MEKKITALLLTLIMLCITAAACAATGLALAQETKITMQIVREEDKLPITAGVTVGERLRVTITVENTTEQDFPGKMVMYDPAGNLVADFPEPELKTGERVECTGTWTVTEQDAEDGRITYTIRYSYRDEDGQARTKLKHFSKKISIKDGKTAEPESTPEPTPTASPEPTPRPEERPEIVLFSVTKPNEELGMIGVCCIDAAGDCWSVQNADLDTDYTEEELLQLLLERRGMELSENLDSVLYADERYIEAGVIRDLKSMADTVKEGSGAPEETGYDGDANLIYALQYDADGNPVPVLLGANGSEVYENKDPNAQALYAFMWENQYLYEPCGYAAEGLTPHGFEPVSARQFFGLENVDAETAVITAAMQDCEEGPIEVKLTEEDREKVRAILERGVIIGKQNAWILTGGTMCYYFQDAQGEYLGCIETYREDGLAVSNDGMYRMSLLPAGTENLPEEEKQLLRIKIAGIDLELGKSTPRDVIRTGWYCQRETDGCFSFHEVGGDGEIYLYTREDSPDEPIISIGCQFAYTIPVEYCGFDGIVDPENPEDSDTIWRMKAIEDLKKEIAENGEDEDDNNLAVDPYEVYDEDERGDGLYWGSLETWMLTLGEEDEDTDNGTAVETTLSDGHTLRLFTAASPVSLSLGETNYIRLGPDKIW
ncbi:MAG: hypothetical protein K6F61_02790 [Clostridiales bacterium]|nr:hypothetical protein [Clostridiales bacterium]